MNILMTSGGRRVAMIREFRRALSDLGVGGQVFVADMTPMSSAFQDADAADVVPPCRSEHYVDALLEICNRRNVTLLIPFIDTELEVLAAARQRFADAGVNALVSGPLTMAISADKRKTAQYFQAAGILTPVLFHAQEAIAGACPFPMFIKPADGSAGVGSRVIADRDELAYWLPRTGNPILMEYVVGREYTVDVYTGFDGTVRCAVPRRRLRIRAGEVEKGITEYVPSVMDQAMAAARALPDARGVLTYQCIVGADDVPRFFEINARLGGGAPLSVRAGADFPRWILEEALGREPTIGDPAFEPGVLMLRYDDAVFVSNAAEWVG